MLPLNPHRRRLRRIRVGADGVKNLDIRMTLKTQDGEFILLTYQGRVEDGANRVGMIFETSSKKLDFLNKCFCVGIGAGVPNNDGTRSAK